MKRFEDWPERLNEFMKGTHVFDWTTVNCVLFSANAVQVQTGVDFAKAYRGAENQTRYYCPI